MGRMMGDFVDVSAGGGGGSSFDEHLFQLRLDVVVRKNGVKFLM